MSNIIQLSLQFKMFTEEIFQIWDIMKEICIWSEQGMWFTGPYIHPTKRPLRLAN